MNPMVYIGAAGLVVTLGGFLLGTLYSRWSAAGAQTEAVKQLQEKAKKLDETDYSQGKAIATITERVAGLDRALDERYDSTRKLHERLDGYGERMTRQEERCKGNLERCNTARHIIEPGRGGGSGGVVSGDGT